LSAQGTRREKSRAKLKKLLQMMELDDPDQHFYLRALYYTVLPFQVIHLTVRSSESDSFHRSNEARPMIITVLGSGNGSCAVVIDCDTHGHEDRLFDSEIFPATIEAIREAGGSAPKGR